MILRLLVHAADELVPRSSPTILPPPYHLLSLHFALALFNGLDDVTAIWYIDGARQTVDHLVSDALGDVAAELSLFALVFFPETGLHRLVEIFAADSSSFLNNVEENFLRALVSA